MGAGRREKFFASKGVASSLVLVGRSATCRKEDSAAVSAMPHIGVHVWIKRSFEPMRERTAVTARQGVQQPRVEDTAGPIS